MTRKIGWLLLGLLALFLAWRCSAAPKRAPVSQAGAALVLHDGSGRQVGQGGAPARLLANHLGCSEPNHCSVPLSAGSQ